MDGSKVFLEDYTCVIMELRAVSFSSFAELGCTVPLSGGAQAYLAYSYGPLISFLYSWTAISTLTPGSCAAIALIFGYVLQNDAIVQNEVSI